MNARIKELRKALHLTQSEFGERIGVKGNTITNYENSLRIPSDAVILSICREFTVYENWLGNGDGEMFLQLDVDEEIAAYVGRTLKNEKAVYQRKLLLFFSRLSPELLDELEKKAQETFGA